LKKLIYIILIFSFPISVNCQWFSQASGTSRHLFGLDVVNENVVYCAAQQGENVKTTNGGITWYSITPPVLDNYGGCSFINPDTGIFVGPPGQLIRTTDGGASWTVIYHQLSGLRNVQFVNSNWVYACGTSAIIRSTDSGLSWSMLQNFNYGIANLYFTDSLTGTIVGSLGFIATTSNGGTNWTQRYMMLPVQFADSTLYSLQFVNSLTGYISGNLGIFVKTTNGGINWNYIPSGTIALLQAIYFTSENVGVYVASAGRIYKTTNGGNNWMQQNSGTTDPLRGVEFINENTGWVCGFNGRILKTTNGGSTWIQPINSELPNGYKLEQNFPNPFNPSTDIKFSIPKNGLVKLTVYDMLGKEISVLVNEKMGAGNYKVSFDGSNCPSGTYFYKLVADGFSTVKRMVILK